MMKLRYFLWVIVPLMLYGVYLSFGLVLQLYR